MLHAVPQAIKTRIDVIPVAKNVFEVQNWLLLWQYGLTQLGALTTIGTLMDKSTSRICIESVRQEILLYYVIRKWSENKQICKGITIPKYQRRYEWNTNEWLISFVFSFG